MTALHQLIPFGDEMKTKQFIAYLGHDLPDNAQYGRNPQPEELIAAFERAGLASDYAIRKEGSHKSWALIVTDASSERLRIAAKLRGQEIDNNLLFTVNGDREILEFMIAHLPSDCGSYLISTDGQNPAVITAGS